jgi:hypothetical protein
MWLALILACGPANQTAVIPSAAELPVRAAPPAQPVSRASTLIAGREWTLSGLCEPSGAVLHNGQVIIGDDDRRTEFFATPLSPASDVSAVTPTTHASRGSTLELDDVEAAAIIGDEAWWTTSHSRDRVARTRIAMATAAGDALTGVTSLDFLRQPGALEGHVRRFVPDCDVPDDTHALRPKQGGIDAEGLAATQDHLYMGFRGPVSTDGRAIVLALDRASLRARALSDIGKHGPDSGGASLTQAEQEALVVGAWCLDLSDKRGVRSLDADPRGEGLIGIAGQMGPGGSFDLFEWSPGEPPAVLGGLQNPDDTSPEGLVAWMEESALVLRVLFDEGTRVQRAYGCECAIVSAGDCKGIPQSVATSRMREYRLRSGNNAGY